MNNIKLVLENTYEILPKLTIGIFVFLLFLLISWLLKQLIVRKIKPKTKNPLLAEFIGKIVAFLFTLIGFAILLHIIGLGGFAKHIAAGAGITTFIIGFAFKDIGENFLSGILMAFKSPFSIGDLIETAGIIGYVYALNLRETMVKTLDGKDVFIPNGQLIKTPLINYTIDGYLRYEIQLGVDYNSDIQSLIEIIKEELIQISEVLQGDKKPVIVLDELLSSSIIIKVYYWINTLESKSKAYHLNLKSRITVSLLKKLTNEGVYLPSDIVELKNYKNELFSVTGKEK